jgi:hypothetical protein
MRLRQHLELIQNILNSRQEITIDSFRLQEIVPGREGIIEVRLRFWDGSLLEFVEVLIEHGVVLVKTEYAYHYQDAQNQLIFRYDNAPHHPEISTHPHHKHTPQSIEPATPPHLGDVILEVDKVLYPENR